MQIPLDLVLPPFPRSGVCSVCSSVDYELEDVCRQCAAIQMQLGQTLLPVSPIMMYRKPSEARDWLSHYKPNVEVDVDLRAVEILSAIVHEYLWALFRKVGPVVDAITVVPSSTRPPPHPLESLLQSEPTPWPVERLLIRSSEPVGHNLANVAAYVPMQDVAGSRVLLLDDVYTTGARAQSARSALLESGAEVPYLIAIGRRLNTDYRAENLALWQHLSGHEFSVEEAIARVR
jgi:predicted amidophosphoribosyltransferase